MAPLAQVKEVVLRREDRWVVGMVDVWPKSSFRFFRKMLWENLNELFGQPSVTAHFLYVVFYSSVK